MFDGWCEMAEERQRYERLIGTAPSVGCGQKVKSQDGAANKSGCRVEGVRCDTSTSNERWKRQGGTGVYTS